jgi:putative tricarboxylic transport membrane protein
MSDRRGIMNLREMISGVVFLLIAVFVLTASLHLGVGALHHPGPGFLLFWAGILLAICACILLGIGLSKKGEPAHDDSTAWNRAERRNAAIVMAALIGYCLALPKLGYSVSTFALMAVLFGLGRMKPWMVVLCSLMTVLLSYYLFAQLLRTPLPRGVPGF